MKLFFSSKIITTPQISIKEKEDDLKLSNEFSDFCENEVESSNITPNELYLTEITKSM